MSELAQRRIPWTEKFRPKTLDEVILTKSQKETIEDWWRKWVIWWNMRLYWFEKYGIKWREFLLTDRGKEWVKGNISKWKDSFINLFENILKKKGYDLFFEKSSSKKKTYTTVAKKSLRKEASNLLEEIWATFLSKAKEKIDVIPPFPPYKPLLLIGPPGTGKTTSVYALAWQEGVVVIEFNASDKRNATIIKSVVREATMNIGFASAGEYNHPPRIILLDEVDGLNPREDRGGFSSVLKLISETKFPIAFTANVMHDRKVRTLMGYSITVFFDRPRDYQVEKLIKMIASKAKMIVPDDVREYLKKYAPDFRTVVSALETYYYTKRLPVIFHEEMNSLQDAIRMAFSFKVRSNGKIDLVGTMKKTLDYLSSIEGVDPRDLMLWSWENATSFVEPKNLFGFLEGLAKADYLYKLGSTRGNWRVAYRDAMNILAWSMAKYGKMETNIWNLRRIKIRKPTIIEELGKIKNLIEGSTAAGEEIPIQRMGLRPLLDKYAKKVHVSRKEAWYDIKFIVNLAKNAPQVVGRLFAELYIPKETIELFMSHFLPKEKEIHKAILKEYEEALGRRGPRVVSLRGMEELPVEKKAERETVSGEAERSEEERERKGKKEEKEKKIRSLDEFFG
ncbi:MAG: AAA family ATPase [Candidatus Njordarchaeia archaeon]